MDVFWPHCPKTFQRRGSTGICETAPKYTRKLEGNSETHHVYQWKPENVHFHWIYSTLKGSEEWVRKGDLWVYPRARVGPADMPHPLSPVLSDITCLDLDIRHTPTHTTTPTQSHTHKHTPTHTHTTHTHTHVSGSDRYKMPQVQLYGPNEP